MILLLIPVALAALFAIKRYGPTDPPPRHPRARNDL